MAASILSIDGGGMKGIITTIVLIRLEEYIRFFSQDSSAKIGEYFDLIGGTSTGSIITALALYPDGDKPKYSAKDIYQMYISLGEKIFVKQSLFPLFGAKYSNQGIKKVTEDIFGDLTLKDLYKPCIITTYDTASRKPTFFNSLTAIKDPNRNPLVREAVMASCSAPTYFPPVCLSSTPDCSKSYIDGGVVANNPSLCALVEGLKLTNCKNLSDILLLSVGNAENDENFTYRQVKKWGLLEWALPLLSILLNTSDQTVHYQLRSIFHTIGKDDNYLRLEKSDERKIPSLDDFSPEAIGKLVTMGLTLADDNNKKIKDFAKKLVDYKKS